LTNFSSALNLNRKIDPKIELHPDTKPQIIIEESPLPEKKIIIIPPPIIVEKLVIEDTSWIGRMEEEKRNNAANEEYLSIMLAAAAKRMDREKCEEQDSTENALGVIILLPLLLEFASNMTQENSTDITGTDSSDD